MTAKDQFFVHTYVSVAAKKWSTLAVIGGPVAWLRSITPSSEHARRRWCCGLGGV